MFRLFHGKEHAKVYAQHRPRYTPAVYDSILSFLREGGAGQSLVVDIACGSGQSTAPLAEKFDRVIGIDHSEAQIEEAPKEFKNVEFRTGAAEDLSFLGDGTVDLITCAQGLHWLNFERMFAEAKRVLTTGGAFVAYGYGLCKLSTTEGDRILQKFHEDIRKFSWRKELKMCDDLYEGLQLPFRDFTRDDNHTIVYNMTVTELLNFLNTYSNWQELRAADPETTLMTDVETKLNALYPVSSDGEPKLTVTWPVAILMGRK